MNYSAHSLKKLQEDISKFSTNQYDEVHVTVRLHNRQCTQENHGEIFNTLSYFKPIQNFLDLDLCDDQLDDDQANKIAEFLSNHLDIKKLFLNLTGNKITNQGVIPIMQSISSMKNLQTLVLRLGWNFELGDQAVKDIGNGLQKLQKLKSVCIVLDPKTAITEQSESVFRTLIQSIPNLTQAQFNFKDCFGYM